MYELEKKSRHNECISVIIHSYTVLTRQYTVIWERRYSLEVRVKQQRAYLFTSGYTF